MSTKSKARDASLDPPEWIASTVDEWLAAIDPMSEAGRLLHRPASEQRERGYEHTLQEILQQPVTWIETARRLATDSSPLAQAMGLQGGHPRPSSIVLTGSGSSLYAAECLALPLQEALGISVQAIAAGTLLTHPHGCLPPKGPYLVVSFARSGNSPESRAVVESLLERDDRGRHLIITCNRQGALVTGFAGHPRICAVVLDEKTEDKSLVMTSSLTNMVVAGRFLAWTDAPQLGAARVTAVARAGACLAIRDGDVLAATARSGFRRALYLGSGCRLGSAHEAGLKMLEMTSGRVACFSESFLGLRHGPMSAVHDDTLVVAFLSSDPLVRAYELDLLQELDHKGLGARKLVAGSEVPASLSIRPQDHVVECGPGLGDAELVVLDALVAQLLAFHRCLQEGLKPDSPSSEGIINRVVESFTIHRRA